ncbi:MAG: hypothetical protein IH940_12755 [Acidobacteria bacterium]|nr:hypothetical protein [Acidobacteriota bacterium]
MRHLEWAQQRFPDVADTTQRAASRDPRLWQRRPDHDDFAQINIGVAAIDWEPEFVKGCPDGVRSRIEALGPLANSPVTLDLSSTIGIVGPDTATRALARSILIQLAVHQGPADVTFAAMTNQPDRWRWIEWLPHCAHDEVGPIADTPHRRGELTRWRDESTNAQRWVLVDDHRIVDEPNGLREAIAATDRGIVLAASRDQLPDSCKSIVLIDSGAETARVERPTIGAVIEDVSVAGVDAKTAEATARSIARFRDPEAGNGSAQIAPRARLVDLIDFDDDASEVILGRWRNAAEKDSLEIPIGVDAGGIRKLDLVADGPHALIAGTTGSGKSELLRTIVASLAVHHSPTEVNVVLIDYKGGSAFDACADLVHTVGVVTDLDDGLAQRALLCLNAELRHREHRLRDGGVSDIRQYRSLSGSVEPLPRLVVIIDEFATLAAELPTFIDALVDIAQRGRSLGVHLILATQRPAGAIKENIKTNTNMRIALRVVDKADSTDVLADPAAADIGRHLPGRGFLRLGPAELIEFQSAIVSEHGPTHRESKTLFRVDETAAPLHERTDLERLVEVVNAAWSGMQRPAPRRPWPDPLPRRLKPDELGEFDTRDDGVALALCDLPREQRFEPWVWRPDSGHLLCYSRDGVGTILATAARLMAQEHAVADCHIYALDQGDRTLEVLRELPHCGAVIGPDERERQQRLIGFLDDTLRARRGGDRSGPALTVVIASWATLCSEFDGYKGSMVTTALNRLFSDGAAVGIYLLVGAARAQAIPAALVATTANRLAFSLAERSDYLAFGLDVTVDPAKLPPGRGYHIGSGVELQMPSFDTDDRFDVDPASTPQELLPKTIETLPERVGRGSLRVRPPAELDQDQEGHPLEVDIGLSAATLSTLTLRFHLGEHLAVLGPSRSGRSTTLATIAESAIEGGCDVSILMSRPSVLSATSPLAARCEDASIGDRLYELSGHGRPHLIVVDDAEFFDDEDGHLASIIQRPPAQCHVIVSTRAEHLRAGFRHWTVGVRRSRHAILLRPDDTDGDLFGTRLDPRMEIAPIAGRGVYLSDGTYTVCQVATPEDLT